MARDRSRSWLWKTLCLSLATAGCTASSGGQPGTTILSRLSPSSAQARKEKASPGLQLAYAKWQEQAGNVADARTSYQTVLGDDPRSVDAVLGLARLDQLAGRTDLAEQGYRKALRLKPNDPATLDAAGQFYASQNRWPEAIEMLTAAATAAPERPGHRFQLAVTLARSGDIDAALPHFAATVGEAQASYNVGYILHEQGDLAGAEEHYLQALLKKPDLGEAQVMLDELRQEHAKPGQMIADAPPARHAAPEPAARPAGPVIPDRPAWTPSPQPVAHQDPPGWHANPAEAGWSATPPRHAPSVTAPESPGAVEHKPDHIFDDGPGFPQQSSGEPMLPTGLSQQQYEQWQNQLRMDEDNEW